MFGTTPSPKRRGTGPMRTSCSSFVEQSLGFKRRWKRPLPFKNDREHGELMMIEWDMIEWDI